MMRAPWCSLPVALTPSSSTDLRHLAGNPRVSVSGLGLLIEITCNYIDLQRNHTHAVPARNPLPSPPPERIFDYAYNMKAWLASQTNDTFKVGDW